MEKLTNIIESILFVSGNAVAISDISERLGCSDKEILFAAKELQKKYSDPCGVNLLIFNKKLQFASNPKYAENVAIVLNPIRERELSKSMLETVAIIAYKQPVTRLDLEEIRGNSEYAVQVLIKLGIIEIVGRKDAVGRPALFGTTDEFLKKFEISSLDELPDYEVLMSRIRSVNGTDNNDSYLFRKDEYVEGQEDHKTVRFDDIARKSEDFELRDISEEEVPDFLDGEEFSMVSFDENEDYSSDEDYENED